MSYRVFAVLVLTAVMSGFHAHGAGTSSVQELIAALRDGGNILYMRHATTDRETRDRIGADLSDCSQQRNLSAAGRAEAERIGQVLRQLQIPIGEVYSSPYCRCRDTARLAFGEYSVEPDLQFSISKNASEAAFLAERLRQMMQAAEPGAGNTVFVGHTANLRDGLNVWPKPEGVVAVFRQHNGVLDFLGMIEPDGWPAVLP